jgi:hypothetical protein
MHLILDDVEEAVLSEQVRRMKGASSTKIRLMRGLRGYGPIWAQKFNRRPLLNQRTVETAIAYVHQNHMKHVERWGEGLIVTWETGIRPLLEQTHQRKSNEYQARS